MSNREPPFTAASQRGASKKRRKISLGDIAPLLGLLALAAYFIFGGK